MGTPLLRQLCRTSPTNPGNGAGREYCLVTQRRGSGVGPPEFQSSLGHFQAVWPSAAFSISYCVCRLLRKTGIKTALARDAKWRSCCGKQMDGSSKKINKRPHFHNPEKSRSNRHLSTNVQSGVIHHSPKREYYSAPKSNDTG